MHLDRKGLYLEAVHQFKKAGGDRIILVQKPTFPQDLEGFISAFDETVKMSKEIREYVECYPVIGLHPAEFERLFNREKKDMCYKILDVVETYVEEKKVVAMGEFGRPHYPVSHEVFLEAHDYMVEALKRARLLDCPIQLHTESLDEKGGQELDKLVKELGHEKVIKHFSPPSLAYDGMIPSILATEPNITAAVSGKKRFLMETDFIDDPRRPGAVLGPKTVPKTVKNLLSRGVLTENILEKMDEDIVALYRI